MPFERRRGERGSIAARPILHIGYHKTATSWFQQQLYPHVHGARTLTQEESFEHILRSRAFDFNAQGIREALASGGGNRLVLCDEELSGNIHSGGLHGFLSKEVACRLAETFPDGEVVVFLRSQMTAIAAAYLQYVRMGGTHPVDRYLFHPEEVRPSRTPLFSFGHFDYDRLLRHYERLFGQESLHVYLYEDFQRDRTGFLRRFARDLGLEVDLDRVAHRPENVSYQWRTLALARLLNRFSAERVVYKHYLVHVPHFYGLTRRLLRRLDRLSCMGGRVDAESLLDFRTLAEIRQRYAPGNSFVAARYELDLRGHGYPVVDQPPEPLPARKSRSTQPRGRGGRDARGRRS